MSLTRLVLHKEYARRMGKTRLTLRFRPGVNLLIGPNGSGKSTVIDCLRHEVLVKEKRNRWGEVLKNQKRHATWDFAGESLKVFFFDFEKDNPRIGECGSLMTLADFKRMSMRMKYEWKSHGEFTRDVLSELDDKLRKIKGKVFVMMDEPEQALDLDGLRLLHCYLTKRPKSPIAQAIIATHHPFLMADSAFHVVEMQPGYHTEMMAALRAVAQQL